MDTLVVLFLLLSLTILPGDTLMASVSFAYGSFGDAVETIKLIVKTISLIRSGGMPSEEWLATERELQALSRELTHLTTLQLVGTSQLIANRLKEETKLSNDTVNAIKSRIQAQTTASRNVFQTIRWVLSEKKDLAEFRQQLGERRAALSGVVEQITLSAVQRVSQQVQRGEARIATGMIAVSKQVNDQGQALSLAITGIGEQVQMSTEGITAGVSGAHQQLERQEQVLLAVQSCLDKVSDEMGLGNDRIVAGMDSVNRQLNDQEQAVLVGFTDLGGHLDDVAKEVCGKTNQIQADVSGVSKQLTVQEQLLRGAEILALEEKLQKWLEFPPSMAGKQHETQKMHEQGTGDWFLKGRQFAAWKENSGCLWMKGQSGTGKTVLSSTVIQKLFDDRKRFTQGAAITYFYFDFTDERKQRVEMMLRSIILQLSAQSRNPYAALDMQYELFGKGQTLPTYQNLVDVLQTLLSDLDCTYIVLDALDEAKDTNHLVQLILRLHNWKKSRVHLLLTSQPRQIFTNAFVGIPQVTLEFTTTRSDIHLFVSSQLLFNPDLEHLAHHAECIVTRVVEKSNGMFRLAACLIEELSRQKLDPDIDAIMNNLPGDLFGIYSRFLKPIHPHDFIYVTKVLHWLLCSRRPVTAEELRDALAFNFSNPQRYIFDPTKRGNQADQVCKMLQGLITVSSPSSSSVVILAHSSVADYIVSPEFSLEYHHNFGHGASDTFLAQACLGYLLHFANDKGPIPCPPYLPGSLSSYPLLDYAAASWDHHHCISDDRASLLAATIDLLEYENRWKSSYHPILIRCILIKYTEGVKFLLENGVEVNATTQYTTYTTSALKFASKMGYIEIVQLLLKHGANIKTSGNNDALEVACEEGHRDIIQLLLVNGANISTGALQVACHWGHTEIVQLLLHSGLDMNAMGGKHGSALMAASQRGSADIVQLLLMNSPHMNTMAEISLALHVACDRGHTETVRLLLKTGHRVHTSMLIAAARQGHTNIIGLLLENGVNFTTLPGSDKVLQVACEEGHIEIVQLLLKGGANVNISGTGVLQVAYKWGYIDIVQLLLTNGADANAVVTPDGHSLLYLACQEGQRQVVKLLLDHGAKVVASGRDHQTALHVASANGDIYIVHLLLNGGADINAVAGYYGTPLQASVAKGHTDIMEVLLACGANIYPAREESPWELACKKERADIHTQWERYDLALCHAITKGQETVVQLLINWGANVNTKSGEFGTPLQGASYYGYESVAQFLLDRGAEIDAQGPYGTAIQLASFAGHASVVGLLLNRGADISIQGEEYGTPLHQACAEGHEAVVELLLSRGADINAEGEFGTPLQGASCRGHESVARLLLGQGASINASGPYGTALHQASAEGHEAVVRLLLDWGADIDVQGPTGTPLQDALARGHEGITQLFLTHCSTSSPTAPSDRAE